MLRSNMCNTNTRDGQFLVTQLVANVSTVYLGNEINLKIKNIYLNLFTPLR